MGARGHGFGVQGGCHPCAGLFVMAENSPHGPSRGRGEASAGERCMSEHVAQQESHKEAGLGGREYLLQVQGRLPFGV